MVNYTYSNGPELAVKNKLGAITHAELEKFEAKYVFARDAEIAAGYGPSGHFDAEHLKAIHRHLFQDVYEWAGHTRDEKVALADDTVATEPLMRKVNGDPFMAGPLIPDALERIAGTLRHSNYLRDLSREHFAEQAADIMVEINGAHPFREGNGRTQRVFIRELAKEAGHELDFSVVTRERMVQASIAANERGDGAMMRRMFNEISDPVRVAGLDKAIDALNANRFSWNEAYIATAEPHHNVELTMAGIAGEQFMARTATAILIGQVSDLPVPRPGAWRNFYVRANSVEAHAAVNCSGHSECVGLRPRAWSCLAELEGNHRPARRPHPRQMPGPSLEPLAGLRRTIATGALAPAAGKQRFHTGRTAPSRPPTDHGCADRHRQ